MATTSSTAVQRRVNSLFTRFTDGAEIKDSPLTVSKTGVLGGVAFTQESDGRLSVVRLGNELLALSAAAFTYKGTEVFTANSYTTLDGRYMNTSGDVSTGLMTFSEGAVVSNYLRVVSSADANAYSEKRIFTRLLPQAVGGYAEVASFNGNNGAFSFNIEINDGQSGGGSSKKYFITGNYDDYNGAGWKEVLPISTSGPRGGDYALDIGGTAVTFGAALSFRLRTTQTLYQSTGLSATILIESLNSPFVSALFGGSSGGASVSGLYNKTALTQVAGNVGVGVATPLTRLHVGGDYSRVRVGDTGAGDVAFQMSLSGVLWNFRGQTGMFAIEEEGIAQRFRIEKGTGNVGIGISGPASKKLEVQGDIQTLYGDIYLVTTGGQVKYRGSAHWNLGYHSTADSNFSLVSGSSGVTSLYTTHGGNTILGGSTDAGYRLDVIGSMRASSVLVGNTVVNPNEIYGQGTGYFLVNYNSAAQTYLGNFNANTFVNGLNLTLQTAGGVPVSIPGGFTAANVSHHKYFKSGDFFNWNSPFGFQTLSSPADSYLYAADKRFAVTYTGSTGSDNLWSGGEGPAWFMVEGATSTVNINLTSKGVYNSDGLVYPDAVIYLGYYSTYTPQQTRVRTRRSNGIWSVWATATRVPSETQADRVVHRVQVPHLGNFVDQIEIEVTAPAGLPCWVTGIWMIPGRLCGPIALVNKLAPMDMWYDWKWYDNTGTERVAVSPEGRLRLQTSNTGANAIEVRRSDNINEIVFSVTGEGLVKQNLIGVGVNATTAVQALIVSGTPGRPVLWARGAYNQTANLQEWQADGGTNLSSVSSQGHIRSSVYTGQTAYSDIHFGGGGSGSSLFYMHDGGLRTRSNHYYGWGDNTWANSALDTALGRAAAGVVEITNGTSGQFRDLRLRSLTASNNAVVNNQLSVGTTSTVGAVTAHALAGNPSVYLTSSSGAPYLQTQTGSVWQDNGGGGMFFTTGPSGEINFRVRPGGGAFTSGIYIAPSRNVSIAGEGDYGHQLHVTGTGKFTGNLTVGPFQIIDTGGNNGRITLAGTGSLDFGTGFLFRNQSGSTEYARFSTTGNFLIGTSANGIYKLDVNGSARVSGTSVFENTVTIYDDILPFLGYESNLGSATSKFLSIHAAELRVTSIVSQDEVITTGGRQIVGTSTHLIADVLTGDATIDVKHNNLAVGHKIRLESRMQVEWMNVTSAATVITGGFRYGVTRSIDPTEAKAWEAGDGIHNTGVIGTGFIDQYAINSVMGTGISGPSTAYMVRFGNVYNEIEPRALMGSLTGFYGYGAGVFGFAAGKFSGSWISVDDDPEKGLRFMAGTAELGYVRSGTMKIGSLEVTSTTTKIAGWTANATSFVGGNATLHKDGYLDLQNAGASGVGGLESSIRLWGGATYANRANAPFRVQGNGKTYALDLVASGSISAGYVTIGNLSSIVALSGHNGIYINADNYWHQGPAEVDQDGNFYSGAQAFSFGGLTGITFSSPGGPFGIPGPVAIGSNATFAGSIVVGVANKLWLNEGGDGQLAVGGTVKATAPFRVSAAGNLVAVGATLTSATVSGTITAGLGNIAGWEIQSTRISKGNTASSGAGIALHLSSANSGAGAFYSGDQKLQGLSLTWHRPGNAGHLVFGQIAANSAAIKTGFTGIQMMDHLSNEYFALSADTNTDGAPTVYNRIAGWHFSHTAIYQAELPGFYGDNIYMSTTNDSIGVGGNVNFYAGRRLKGFGMKWCNDFNAGHIIMGQMAASGNSIKTGFLGIQMMDYEHREYFALGANSVTSGSNNVYNRIGGWAFSNTSLYSVDVVGGSNGVYTTNNGLVLGKDGWISGPKFAISKEGVIKAIDVDLTGAIYATSGTFTGTLTGSTGVFGGVTINSSGVTGTGFSLGTTSAIGGWALDSTSIRSANWAGGDDGRFTTAGIKLDSGGWISSPKFSLSSDGTAMFAGDISGASGSFEGSLVVGTTAYIGELERNYMRDSEFADTIQTTHYTTHLSNPPKWSTNPPFPVTIVPASSEVADPFGGARKSLKVTVPTGSGQSWLIQSGQLGVTNLQNKTVTFSGWVYASQASSIECGINCFGGEQTKSLVVGWNLVKVTVSTVGSTSFDPADSGWKWIFRFLTAGTYYVQAPQVNVGSTRGAYQPTTGGALTGTLDKGLWAIRGGFGGTVAAPGVGISTGGLTAGGGVVKLASDGISIAQPYAYVENPIVPYYVPVAARINLSLVPNNGVPGLRAGWIGMGNDGLTIQSGYESMKVTFGTNSDTGPTVRVMFEQTRATFNTQVAVTGTNALLFSNSTTATDRILFSGDVASTKIATAGTGTTREFGSYAGDNGVNDSGFFKWYTKNATAVNTLRMTLANNGDLAVTGNVTFTSTSDERLKANIEELDGLAILRTIRGVSYDWRDGSGSAYGVIAQDVQRVLPHAVASRDDGTLAVAHLPLIGALFAGVRAVHTFAETEVQKLKRQNRTLRERVTKLESRMTAATL